MKEIKLGTIGSGVIVHSILDAVQQTEGIQCEAVYSRSETKGKDLADQYQVKKVYTDMEAFLSDPELNFIYIATPNSLHYEQIKKALEHGKNVICEKPFCVKKSQVEEVVALAKEKELFLIDAVPTFYLPNFQVLREKLPEVGRLRMVMCNYTQYSSRYDQLLKGEVTNIFNPEFGGGCLQDINFYNVFLNVALFGKPLDVVYFANVYPGAADTSGIVMMRYDHFVTESAGSKDAHGENFVQIEGEKGYIYVKGGSNGIAEVRLVTKEKEETINLQDNPDRWFYEIQKITQMVQADDYAQVYANLDTTINVIDTLEKARKSAGIQFPND